MADSVTRGKFVRDHFNHSGIVSKTWLEKTGRMLNNISIEGAESSVSTRGIRIQVTPGNRFSGTAYVSGTKYTGLKSDSDKPYVKIDLTANPVTVTEETGPPADPFPDGEEWYPKATTSGDIHLSRM